MEGWKVDGWLAVLYRMVRETSLIRRHVSRDLISPMARSDFRGV